MEAEEQVAQLKKEKAEVECQLKVALGRIVELEEESTLRVATLLRRIVELEEELKQKTGEYPREVEDGARKCHRTIGRNAEPNRGAQRARSQE